MKPFENSIILPNPIEEIPVEIVSRTPSFMLTAKEMIWGQNWTKKRLISHSSPNRKIKKGKKAFWEAQNWKALFRNTNAYKKSDLIKTLIKSMMMVSRLTLKCLHLCLLSSIHPEIQNLEVYFEDLKVRYLYICDNTKQYAANHQTRTNADWRVPSIRTENASWYCLWH